MQQAIVCKKEVANHSHFFKVVLSDVDDDFKNQKKVKIDISILYRKSLMVTNLIRFNYIQPKF